MKKYLSAKAGVTILEGVIALGLLALVTAGAFGVLLSAARQGSEPDLREEMALAVGKVNDLLKMYQETQLGGIAYRYVPTKFASGLCSGEDVEDEYRTFEASGDGPLGGGKHTINCMLPPICDRSNGSTFVYEVMGPTQLSSNSRLKWSDLEGDRNSGGGTHSYGNDDYYTMAPAESANVLEIRYTIRCNGYEL